MGVVFRAWSLMGALFHRGWPLMMVMFHVGGLSWEWSFIIHGFYCTQLSKFQLHSHVETLDFSPPNKARMVLIVKCDLVDH